MIQLDERIKRFASAARSESDGLQQISDAVTAMDQAMQRNAAQVEQSTAASHLLAAEAATLAERAAQFRIVATPWGEGAHDIGQLPQRGARPNRDRKALLTVV